MENEAKKLWSKQEWDGLIAFVDGDHSAFSSRLIRYASIADQQAEVSAYMAETLELPFSDSLLRMIDLRGMSDVEVYKAAKVDRRVFSKIRSSSDYQPSRGTAIRLCLALHMTALEAMVLLEKAGYALSHSKKGDIVIEYCMDHGIFDVEKVNEALLQLNLEGIL